MKLASGFPSLVKAAMRSKNGDVVPNADFMDEAMKSELHKLNMAIRLIEESFESEECLSTDGGQVPTSTQAWPKSKSYIAINKDGVGESNTHYIIKAAPAPKARPHQGNAYSTDEVFLFVLSANNKAALGRTKEQLAHFSDRTTRLPHRRAIWLIREPSAGLSLRSVLFPLPRTWTIL